MSTGGKPTSTTRPSWTDALSRTTAATVSPVAATTALATASLTRATRDTSAVAIFSTSPGSHPVPVPPRGSSTRRVVATRRSNPAYSLARAVSRAPNRKPIISAVNSVARTISHPASAAASPVAMARSMITPTSTGTSASAACQPASTATAPSSTHRWLVIASLSSRDPLPTNVTRSTLCGARLVDRR